MGFALLLIGAGLGGIWLLTHGRDETPAPGATPTSSPELQSLLASVPAAVASERDPARLEQLAAMLESAGQTASAAVVRQQAATLRTAAAAAASQAAAAAQRPVDWTPPFPAAAPGAPSPAAPVADALTALAQQAAAAVRPPGGGGPAEAPASPETAGIHPARLILARASAIRVDNNLRTSGRSQSQRRRRYNQDLMKYFQGLAGLTPDGKYGGRTRSALQFFGVQNPIPAFESGRHSYSPDLAVLRQPPPEPPPGVSASGRVQTVSGDELDSITAALGDELEGSSAGDDDEATTAALGQVNIEGPGTTGRAELV